jgi:multisubunit Na+/H+ antiporter MnhG subunit
MNTFTPTKLYQNYEAILLKRQLFLVAVFSFLGAISFAQVPSYYNGTNISQNGSTLKSSLATLISSNTINLSYTPGYGMP